jgi:transcriptional regulator with XRE-family HTH domain
MTPDELKRRRKRLGLSQAQLARYLDVDVMTISRWERGAQAMRMPVVLRKVLDLAEDDPDVDQYRKRKTSPTDS